MLRRFIAAALLAVSGAAGAQTTIGVHLGSHHWPDLPAYSNANPGIYVRTAEGWTAGVYRNSLRRTSVYAGRTFGTDVRGFELALTVGAISGYDRKVPVLVVPSVATPPLVAGVRARIAVIPRAEKQGAAVIHLSAERSF